MEQGPLYLDPDRPVAERVQDLLGRMTLPEKLSQMNHAAAAVPRLKIPAYNYWNEALHGVARNGRATVFPQAIGLAATWNPALIEQIAGAIGDEARAKFNTALQRQGETRIYQGLTFWTPNINIFRDPRWGRGQETWGEDPWLTGEMGAAFVRGLRGNHPAYIKAAACAKHFAVHSGPERERHSFDARVSEQDLRATYLPAFKRLVTGAGVDAVMGAYNRVNGEPCCASPRLLDEILRGEWGFEGHVVSDCGALDDIHAHHRVTAGPVESAALALKNGCDLCCGRTYDHLEKALEQGLIGEADLDRALGRSLTTRFRLGLFDPPERVPYSALGLEAINSPAHRQLALEAARQSLVLLKNKNGLLPLHEPRTVYLVGPMAANLDILLGNYHGLSETLSTLIEGIAGRAPEGVRLEYRAGSQLAGPVVPAPGWLLSEAGKAEVTIACMGLSPLMEGEEGDTILSEAEGDRGGLELPAAQTAFLKDLAAHGAKIVLVLSGGSPIVLGELAELAQAILFIWYPGQAGGQAVAEVLWGDHAPGGRLPVTFPRQVADLPDYRDYSMAGRTYRYMTREPLYPFGFGLSYTEFAYSDLKLDRARVPAGEGLRAEFRLTNRGSRAAEEVAQVYISDVEASVPVPRQSLVGTRRVELAAGESRRLEFEVEPAMLEMVDLAGRTALEAGEFRLTVGGCSPGRRGLELGAPAPVSQVFSVY